MTDTYEEQKTFYSEVKREKHDEIPDEKYFFQKNRITFYLKRKGS